MTVAEQKQSLINVGSRRIELPPWYDGLGDQIWGSTTLPDLSVADSSQKYPLGTKYVDGERIFKYGYAAETHLNIIDFLSEKGVPPEQYKGWNNESDQSLVMGEQGEVVRISGKKEN